MKNKLSKFLLAFSMLFTLFTIPKTEVKAIETITNLEISEPDEVSNLMTLNELIEDYSQTENIPIKQAQAEIYNSIGVSEMTDEEFAEINYTMEYITISSQFTVTEQYKPSMKFYCYVSKSNNFGNIIRILKVSMDRSYDYINHYGSTIPMNKIYDGDVYVNLEDDNTIYYSLDGNWYNTGSSTSGVSTSIEVGEHATISFNASNTSSFYATDFIEKRVQWGLRISL